MPPADDKGVFREITTPTHTVVTIASGNTSEEALAANTSRVYALFINDSDTEMFIKLGADAVDSEGIPLAASGGNYEITLDNLYRGAINVICASASKNLLVTEGV